jgi:uncharacterized protein YbjT (DUF2867 family)
VSSRFARLMFAASRGAPPNAPEPCTSDMSERVCVVGATGHLGSAVVEELCSRNMTVVAVARNSSSSKVSRIQALGATVEFVDASKPQESYATALSCATIAISCLAAGFSHVDETNDFWAIDRDATVRFGRQALNANVKQLVLVSTFEGKDSRSVSAFSNAKEEAVDVLRDECKRAGVILTVLRPNAYFRDLTDSAFDSVLTQGRHMVLGDGSHRINPISREDVAIFMADCVQNKRGGEYLMGGPDVFTFRDIVVLAAMVVGKEDGLKIRSIPLWLLRIVASALGLFGFLSRAARRQVALLHWMIYVSTHDAVAPCCGRRRLVDDYKRKYEEYKIKQS